VKQVKVNFGNGISVS